MIQMWIGTQIGGTLIGPSPLRGFTNRDKNIFYFCQKYYKVLTFFRLKKYYKKKNS